MSTSLVCEACDTLTMMNYCPKCDTPTVPYEPRGSGTLCVGPPVRRGPSVPLSHHDGEGRCSTRRNSLMSVPAKPPYEALAKRLSPSMERPNQSPERTETAAELQEQLAKERELMIQSASDILRITDGFQVAQKKSIRVIDRLYQENQELKQKMGMKADSDPQGWRKRFGFPPAQPSSQGQQSSVYPPVPSRGYDRNVTSPMHGENNEDLLDEIERRARAVERELDDLLDDLGEAERIASEERGRLSNRMEESQRRSVTSDPSRRSRLVSSYH